MPAYIGAAYTKDIFLKRSDDSAVDIENWTFQMLVRHKRGSTVLLDLTTENGGLVVFDAASGQLRIVITAVQTDTLPEGWVHFSMLRTDVDPGPTYLFGGKFKVEEL